MESLSAVATQLSLPDGSFLLLTFKGLIFANLGRCMKEKPTKTDGIKVFVIASLIVIHVGISLQCA